MLHDKIHLQTSEHLETTISQWSEFETLFDNNVTWLKDSELKLKDVDLKSTLPEKKEQHEHIRVKMQRFRFLKFISVVSIILWIHMSTTFGFGSPDSQ